MIIDSFMFCNELDMLQLRLKLLYDYVDKFVILESGWTQSNNKKPFYYSPNNFSWAEDKIIYVQNHETVPLNHDFDVENFQRQKLYDTAIKAGEGILLSSDIDEIPDRDFLIKLRSESIPDVFRLDQDLYYYNVKTPLNKLWQGTTITKTIPCDSNKLRKKKADMATVRSGWHFSYFMSNDQIRFKLKAFSHHKEYSKPPFTDDVYINEHKKNRTNFLKKHKGLVDPRPLPDYLVEELKNFPLFRGEQ